jgi:hypothetical protein
MIDITKFKKIIALSLLITLIPAQSHAAWYDNLLTSFKDNAVTIASVGVGAATVFGLMLWKTSSDLRKLNQSKPTEIAQAKAAGKKEAEDAALKNLDTHKAAIKKAIDAQDLPGHVAINSAMHRNAQRTDKLLTTAKLLQARYSRLLATSRFLLPSIDEAQHLDTLLHKAQTLCERVEALRSTAKPANDSFQKESNEPVKDFKRLKEEITAMHERLETLNTIATMQAAQATSAGYESSLGLAGSIKPQHVYESIGLDAHIAQGCTHVQIVQQIASFKTQAHPERDKTIIQALAAIEKIFKNEIAKTHFDMYLKGHSAFTQWNKIVAEKQPLIKELFDRALNHKLYLEGQIAQVEKLMKTIAASRTYSSSHPQSARGVAAAAPKQNYITTPVTRPAAAINAGKGTPTTITPAVAGGNKPFNHSDE